MTGERHIEINSPNYSHVGLMTVKELLGFVEKYTLYADHVTIGGFVMYGWDEIDMMWAMSENDDNPKIIFHDKA